MPTDLTFLNTLGTKDTGDKVALNHTGQALVGLAEFLINEATRNLQKHGNVATGQTAASMKIVNFKTNAARVSLDVEILKTYKFLDQGVKGTEGGRGKYQFKTKYANKRMATAILKWLRRRSIVSKYRPYSSAQDNLKGKQKGQVEAKNQKIKKAVHSADSLKSLAYAISVGIKKGGIDPTYFFTDAVKATRAQQRKVLAESLKLDIIESLKN